MMVVKKIHISILIIIVFFPLSYAFSGEVTSLSKKASKLNLRMSRQVVISLLGHPTWAVIPSDKGDVSLPDTRIKLELYWKNTPCHPVVVQFDSGYKVTGWDEGRAICGKDAHLFELSNEYSCGKTNRAKLCK
jgi:hypothetical protein